MKFKKFVSGMLACAMVVTSVFTGNVATAKAENTVTLPQPVAAYNFNVSTDDAQPALAKGMELKKSTNDKDANNELWEYDGQAAFEKGRSGDNKDYAVNMNGNYGVILPQKKLGDNWTVSLWVKPTDLANDGWAKSIVFVGKGLNPQKWAGISASAKGGEIINWFPGGNQGNEFEKSKMKVKDEWQMLTLVQSGTETWAYLNGGIPKSNERVVAKRTNVTKGMEDDNQYISLGTNHWDGNYHGIYDDVNVYNQALTAEQVSALYLQQHGEVALKEFNIFASGEDESYVKSDLNLPSTYRGLDITWKSGDTDKIKDDGEIVRRDGSEVSLTASAALPDGTSWSQSYKLKLAKDITVEYVKKGETTPLKTKEVAYKAADSYTYTPTNEDKVWTHTDGKTYVLSETEGDNTLTASGDTPKFTLTYNEDVVTEIVTEVPDMVTRIGVRPALPETVTAKFSSGAERENVKVDWSGVTEDAYAAAGETEVVGKVGAVELKVKLTVKDKADYVIADYTFDKGSDGLKDAVPGSEGFGTKVGDVTVEKGLKGNAAYFPGGAKNAGNIVLPDDLLKVGENADDERNITISLFSKTNTTKNCFAVSLLTKGTGEGSEAKGTDYLGFINHGALRAEYKQGNEEIGRATGTPAVQDKWYHYAIVVNSDAHTMSLYKNGVLQNTLTNDGIDISNLAGGKNYLGYTKWPDPDFTGAIDEFKVYNTTLTQGEIQSICDETLYEEQMKVAKAAIQTLKTTSGEDVILEDVADDLFLPTSGMAYDTTIEWTSDNNDVIDVTTQPGKGAVTPPTDEDATVTLKAKIVVKGYEDRAEEVTYVLKVLKNEGINKRPLLRAINSAKEVLDDATAKGIYVKDSLKKLEDAINAAQEKYDSADITEEEVAEEAAKLKAAEELELKDLDELQEDLTAWYKFEKDASDSSRRHADAEKVGEVTFSKENGATFKGESAALKNMLKMPVDKLKITDQMTFSMQVNAKAARNFFGIGTVVGANSGASKHLYMNSSFVAFMSDNGWFAHTGFNSNEEGNKFAFALNAWHDVTVVLDGKTITLYLDGKKMGTKATETTMTAAWNYEQGTKYAYLGNCAYAHNGTGSNDPDFSGSIKDVRIYNVALDEEQVGYIDAYRAALPMEYAKESLVAQIKDKVDAYALLQEDGSYKVNVSQDALDQENKIDLPATSGAAAVTWESSDEETINASTKVVTLPAQGAEAKEVTLTATLTIGDKAEKVTFVCSAFSIDTSIDRVPLKTLLDQVKDKVETDYTSDSWAAFEAAYEAAVAEYAKPTDADTVGAKKTALETAVAGLVDVTELRSLIEAVEVALGDLTEELYTSESWDALTGKLEDAKTVLGTANATADNVSAAIASLPSLEGEDTVESKLKLCGSREALDDAIEAAEALEAYKDQYTDASWSALETALATAKEEQAKRLESYDSAAAALQAKIDALEVKPEFILSGDKKTEMQGKLNAAKAEAEERVAANYTPASWDAYQKALTALDRILAQDKATIAAANDALAALEEATAALTPVSAQEPNSAVKKSLADAIAGANTNRTYYTTESWAKYQAALDKLTALKTALDTADSEEKTTNITKYEIEKAIEALDTAAGQLVPTEEHAVGAAEKAEMAAAIAEAGTLRKTYYTNDSWTVFEEKLNTLKAMQNSTSVTKEEVKAATEALEDAMNGLVPTEAQTPDADKIAELNTAFENATTANAGMKESDYTAESWEAYQNAYAAMKKVADRLADDAKKGSVTKTEIQTALDNMKTATDGLKRNVDKTALNAAIEGCASLKATDYTTETWNAFQTALNTAKTVAAKDDATQAEVDAALAELNAKKGALARPVAASPVLVNSIKLSATYKNVAAGKKTTVKATVNTDAADKGVTFSSSNSKWATVNAKTGVVTTKKAGAGKTVTITATANDAGKKKQTIKIKIMKNAVTKVTVKKKSLNVKAGKKATIKVTVKTNGKNANKTLSWKSSNTKWATVKNGKVTTKKAGKGKTVKITATSTDGTNKKVTVKVKITK